MRLLFTIFKVFPYGGVQRNFLNLARECLRRGHEVAARTMEWRGPPLSGLDLEVWDIRRLFNHDRYGVFERRVQQLQAQQPFDVVVGFNKMAGLDLYYAGDPCYLARIAEKYGGWYRLTGRYRAFARMERDVFLPGGKTEIMLLSPQEKPRFVQYHGTPEGRFHLLPPGIPRDRLAGPDAAEIRRQFRCEYQLDEQDRLLLLIGSGFRTKGLARAMEAVAALPEDKRRVTRLFAIGDDNPSPFNRLAVRLGIDDQVTIMPGRDDIPRFLLGGDLLVHPAHHENTGNILLEALASGLPVLATDVCGYMFHVEHSGGGVVLPSPFSQEALNQQVASMPWSLERKKWSRSGMEYARREDLYSRTECMADLLEQVGGKRCCN